MRSGKLLARTRDDRLGGLRILEASFANFQQSSGVQADIAMAVANHQRITDSFVTDRAAQAAAGYWGGGLSQDDLPCLS